ncbi:MAG: hypothetical protein V3T72_13205 [Thermoanaerobaculia bacterium]
MGEGAAVEMALVVDQPQQQPQLLEVEVDAPQDRRPLAGVARFDQELEDVEGEVVDAGGESEAQAPRQLLGGRGANRGSSPSD